MSDPAEPLSAEHSESQHRAGYRSDCPACIANDATLDAPRQSVPTTEDAERVAGTLVSELVAGPVHVAAAERLHPMRLHVREGIRALARKYAA